MFRMKTTVASPSTADGVDGGLLDGVVIGVTAGDSVPMVVESSSPQAAITANVKAAIAKRGRNGLARPLYTSPGGDLTVPNGRAEAMRRPPRRAGLKTLQLRLVVATEML